MIPKYKIGGIIKYSDLSWLIHSISADYINDE